MTPGSCTSVAPGENSEMLFGFDAVDDGTGNGALMWCEQPATGYGDDWWAVVGDGIPQSVVYLAEGAALPKTAAAYDPSVSKHVVSLEPLGDWNTYNDIDITLNQQYFESDKGTDYKVDFDAVFSTPTSYENAATHQLTSWALTGFERFATCTQVMKRNTEGKAALTLINTAGTYTVMLSIGGFAIASGSRVGNGSCALSAQNNSGVSGSVTITYAADITTARGAYVLATWAQKYVISGGGKSVTVVDNGHGNRISGTLSGMAAGSQSITITPYSDTGQAGAPFAAGSVLVPGPPAAPGKLSYLIPGSNTDTEIRFTASATAGATYNLYDSSYDPVAGTFTAALNSPIPMTVVAATHAAAGAGTPITWILPNIAAAVGKRRICIVAMNGGTECGVRRFLTIEYDASGNIVAPRPNVPDFRYSQPNPVANGRTITIEYTYNKAGELGVAAQLHAYVVTEGTVNPYTTPDATVNLTNQQNGFYRGTFTVTPAANGFVQILVRAVTGFGGNVESSNTTLTDPIYVSNAVPGNPANVTITPLA